jgi:hypothetical protein
MNDEFWADHGEELEERFNAWAAHKLALAAGRAIACARGASEGEYA